MTANSVSALDLVLEDDLEDKFTPRGEQLIKELDIKQLLGWQEWMKDSVDSNAHEEKVCRRTTEVEVKSVVEKMKLHKAPGVDNVRVAMLKYAVHAS